MTIHGRGLGLRREFAAELSVQPKRHDIDFLEVVPDNWMGVGGESADILNKLAALYPFVAHGLSLSIGDAQPLDLDYLAAVRNFLDQFAITIYSDHLSLSRDSRGYLHGLLPVPRSPASAAYMVDKIAAVQDRLSRRLVLENISYYDEEENQMPEAEFLAEILQRSGCGLLLDVNNVYVNHRNHGSDPIAFLEALPRDAVVYYHVAGHLDLAGAPYVLDTHGAPVSAAVMALGRHALSRFGDQPIVLERDDGVPSLDALCKELDTVHRAMRGNIGGAP
jgi:uncharacterized protein (UPF0276 family)